MWPTLKQSYRILTCSKSCIVSWIATESDKMIEIKTKDTLGLQNVPLHVEFRKSSE